MLLKPSKGRKMQFCYLELVQGGVDTNNVTFSVPIFSPHLMYAKVAKELYRFSLLFAPLRSHPGLSATPNRETSRLSKTAIPR
jgi:hypothetical protein